MYWETSFFIDIHPPTLLFTSCFKNRATSIKSHKVFSSISVPQVEHISSLGGPDTRENRLLLMGGHRGLLALMVEDRVRPGADTLAQLLALAPNTNQVEQEVLGMLEELGIQPTTSLYNQVDISLCAIYVLCAPLANVSGCCQCYFPCPMFQVIHARVMRKEFELGQAALEEMFSHGLTPDIQTFGVLALCCRYTIVFTPL